MKIGENEVEGLRYYPDAIDVEEEARILELCASLQFSPITMCGVTARRTVVCFGYDYQYRSRSVVPVAPLPAALSELKSRCASVASVPDSFDQVIVSRYPAGAGIGWHVDSPVFDDVIVGLSLAAPARLQMKLHGSSASLVLMPRSVYVLGGRARTVWQHRVPPLLHGTRYSITFRTVRPAR